MTEEKWKNILGHIKDNFKIEDEGNEYMEDEGGVDIDYVVFQGPLGKIRLEYVSKPVILDKKTTFSKRIGSETDVQYVYSQDKKSQKLNVYKWDEDGENWVEIDAENFKLE